MPHKTEKKMDENLQMSDKIIQASLYIKICKGRTACWDFLNILPCVSQCVSARLAVFYILTD